jgi:SAM-dependent methyltransferase
VLNDALPAGTPDNMAAYYARRAAEYDGVYAKPERQADIRVLEAALPPLFEDRRVLEIACGTGWWTPHAAARAAHWLATDLNPETMAVAQSKPTPPGVEFRAVDAYTLAGLRDDERFDAAFAGFWWSHVPKSRLGAWLATLHERLEPGARVVFCDNREVPGSTTPIARRDADGNSYQQRRLADGSRHEVLKNFPSRDEAIAALGPRARHPRWTENTYYWTLVYELS